MVSFMLREFHINKLSKKKNNSDAILTEHASRQFDPVRIGAQGDNESAFLDEIFRLVDVRELL